MIGHHGSHGAPRARAAVPSDPARRWLVLAGLFLGALAAVWLAAAPAQAEERTTPASDVLSGVGEGLGHEDALGVSGLHEPLTGAVTDAGDRAAQVVEETSGHLPADVAEPEVPDLGEVTRSVHDDVHTAVEPVTEPEPEAAPAVEEGTEEQGSGHDEGESDRPRDAAPAERPSPVEETVTDGPSAPADAVAAPVDEGPGTGDAAPADASGSGGSALPATAAASAAPVHAAVAGYLSALGAPAPAPGELQAARHVLRSVPAAPADEATFSPD
ncbi:hypothetical protein IDM40_05930 [Nocardiopsis sp. HNM0947]|uniref:Uncharacterized protein n=1 Tax=Nocardiopsis coralli TaxID=2772213 RepID=A0ABR9P337_9ACTN|nr:hypothetical protein [Nocardiopsis coralli]MBE2998244.1 hypothetical protein [Nocardiopsis coralli]